MATSIEDVVTIDFETEEIKGALPPKPVGVAIRPPGGQSYYMAWGHPEGNNCTVDDAKVTLSYLFKTHPILMHNAAFDINVAKHRLGIPYPQELHDTMLLLFLRNPHAFTLALKPNAEAILQMPPAARDRLTEWILANVPGATKKRAGAHVSKAPVSLVGPYACSDVDMTYELFAALYETYNGPAYARECALLPILSANTLEGICLDTLSLTVDFVKYSKIRKEVDRMIYKYLGMSFNIDSPVELVEAITRANLPVEWVLTKTGKKSTSKANLFSAVKDPLLLELLGYRGTLSTYLDTFFASWIDKEDNERIHFSWNQVRNSEQGGVMGTRTGRLSTQPSMLNVPKSPPMTTDRASGAAVPLGHICGLPVLPLMRSYLVPAEGCWISRDFASQELRVLAHFEDGAMMRAYRDNPALDLHQMMSALLTLVLGRPVSRRAAKTIAFSILYGSGMATLAEGLGCSVLEARQIKAAYLRELSGISDVQDSIKSSWGGGGAIKTWGGRKYYKEPSRVIIDKRSGLERLADFGYKGLNYLIQASSADITKQAIINYSSIKKHGRFLVAVHDQLDIEGPLSEMALLREAMHDIKLDVPMISDGSYGANMCTYEVYNDTVESK